jgi:hypothetical protein
VMPRLWNETIEAHRRGVRDAILDTTAALVVCANQLMQRGLSGAALVASTSVDCCHDL